MSAQQSNRFIWGGLALALLSVILMNDDYSGGFWENWANDAGVLGTEIPARWLVALGFSAMAWGFFRSRETLATTARETAAPRPKWQLADNYFTRHWRGELTLAVAFWGSLFGTNVAYGLCVALLSRTNITLYPDVWLAFLLFWAAIWIWAATGVWRSADRYTKSHTGRVWGNVASVVVVLQGFSVAGQIIAAIG